MPPIARRMKELKSGNLSRYVIELVAFDLCRLRAHSLTGPIAQKPLHVQHAVDLAIDRNYVDGKRSNKEQMDRIAKMGPEEVAALGDLGPVKKEKHRVWLRSLHREAVIERSAELGFPDIGEYITSLIRFDLLLGGPHDKFPGDKQFNRAEVLELDKITLEIYEANKPRKCMVDYVVEEIAGRPMTPRRTRRRTAESFGEALREISAESQGRSESERVKTKEIAKLSGKKMTSSSLEGIAGDSRLSRSSIWRIRSVAERK